MKTGLVLEGGAVRGIYTAGVLDVLMEHDIWVDGVVGVSAGAIHGNSYVAKQHGRSIRYYKKYCGDRRFMSFWSLLTTGSLVGEEFCYHELPETLDPFDYEAFEKSPIEFYAVSTNLETGKGEYIRCRDMHKDMEYLLASASMPYVSRTVEVDGKKLLDGGVADSIPLAAARRLGFQKNIVVLTQVKDYVKKPQKMGIQTLKYRKYPEFLKSIAGRHLNYAKSRRLIGQLEEKGEVLAIYPSEELHIGRMEKDPDKVQMMYDLGRYDALNRIDEIRAFLGMPQNMEKTDESVR
ncbi:MAG: patatin family protein [Lachnospiraceae bacterium]|nr:patatin family protein [Lachnospiraceae bacterium]